MAVLLLSAEQQRACAIGRDEGPTRRPPVRAGDVLTVHRTVRGTVHRTVREQQALWQSGFVATSTYEEMEQALYESLPIPGVIVGIEMRPFAPK